MIVVEDVLRHTCTVFGVMSLGFICCRWKAPSYQLLKVHFLKTLNPSIPYYSLSQLSHVRYQ